MYVFGRKLIDLRDIGVVNLYLTYMDVNIGGAFFGKTE